MRKARPRSAWTSLPLPSSDCNEVRAWTDSALPGKPRAHSARRTAGLGVTIVEGVLVDETENVRPFIVRAHHELTARRESAPERLILIAGRVCAFQTPDKGVALLLGDEQAWQVHRAALRPWQSGPSVQSMSRPALVRQRSVPAPRREWRGSMHRSGLSALSCGSLHAANSIDKASRERSAGLPAKQPDERLYSPMHLRPSVRG